LKYTRFNALQTGNRIKKIFSNADFTTNFAFKNCFRHFDSVRTYAIKKTRTLITSTPDHGHHKSQFSTTKRLLLVRLGLISDPNLESNINGHYLVNKDWPFMGGFGYRLRKFSLVLLPYLIVSCSSVKTKTLEKYQEVHDNDEISDRNEPKNYDENHGVTQRTFVAQPFLKRGKRAWENQPYTVPYGYSGSGQYVDSGKLIFKNFEHIVSYLKHN